MGDFIKDTIEAWGYLGLVLLIFAENVFPPIPSELILPLAGYLAQQGEMTLTGVVIAAVAGKVLGSLVLYQIAAAIGGDRLKHFADRHGRWLSLSREEIELAERWFAQHGVWAVCICQVIPGVRSLISIPAGFGAMPLGRFVAASAAGSAVWSAALAGLGYGLGTRFEDVEKYLDPIGNVVVAVIVVTYLYRVARGSGASRRGQATQK